eukprot:CAMPEP_0118941678 /NCGR_PEP_ID=MMETSP1169-20130426/34423_1 /TAXON_ID=36882 /ORGANISM="Pyramimonas obovata, Strain CCMP722" /LENGTH=163 /DNA_ID=CAMNT_0006886505 /DNA_START=379 /DNA_END=871 /DNA_ORIENTATION=-
MTTLQRGTLDEDLGRHSPNVVRVQVKFLEPLQAPKLQRQLMNPVVFGVERLKRGALAKRGGEAAQHVMRHVQVRQRAQRRHRRGEGAEGVAAGSELLQLGQLADLLGQGGQSVAVHRQQLEHQQPSDLRGEAAQLVVHEHQALDLGETADGWRKNRDGIVGRI